MSDEDTSAKAGKCARKKLHMPRNERKWVMVSGTGICSTASILEGSGRTPSPLTRNPRNSASRRMNSHLEPLASSWCSRNEANTASMCCRWTRGSSLREKIAMSSQYTTQYPASMCSASTNCIKRWNAPGTLVNPKGALTNSYKPEGVANAVLLTASSLMRN